MKPIFYFYTSLFFVVFFAISCSGDEASEDCTKTVQIPQFYIVNGQTYQYSINTQVPCDAPDIQEPIQIEPPAMENFSYELLSFAFTPDTGNNTNKLEFEVQLNNGNNESVTGLPQFTLKINGFETTGGYHNDASEPCFNIPANGSCVFTYSVEDQASFGAINTIEFVDAIYYLTD